MAPAEKGLPTTTPGDAAPSPAGELGRGSLEEGGPPSGLRADRSERETTPAPPQSAEEQLASLPSARPTSVPDFDLGAIARASFQRGSSSRLPLDIAVPTRTGKAAPHDLGLRSAFILLHVDDRASIQDIAAMTAIAPDDVVAHLIELVASELVELSGAKPQLATPQSGTRSTPSE